MSSRATTRVVVALLLVAAAWSPLWVRWEMRWFEAAELSGRVVESWRGWRAQAGPDRMLVGLAPVSMVGWTCEVVGLREVDRCAQDLFGLLGPSPVTPAEARLTRGGTQVEISTTGSSIMRWASAPDPAWGIPEIDRGADGYVRRAVVAPEGLRRSAERSGCGEVDLRRWDGSGFASIGSQDN